MPGNEQRIDITVTDERLVRRAVKAAALGNAMEWFDFAAYSYFAVTMGKVFYSGAPEGLQTILSFATFAITFLIRPLGGAFFGPLGDRIGRKRVLAMTMILMASATFLVGLVPSYDSIGIAAPVLLILLRLVQGFSTGGEYGGAATFIAEYSPDKKRGLFGSFLEFGTLVGYIGASVIAAVLQTVLHDDALITWGWRVPFLIGGPIGVIGLYLRLKLEETPAFEKAAEEHGTHDKAGRPKLSADSPKQKFSRIFKDQWPALLLCIALVAAYNITDYALLTYMPTYLTDSLHYQANHATAIVAGLMIAMICAISYVGRLNDRYGRKPLLLAGMLGFLFLTYPSFLLLQQGSLPAVLGGMLMLGVSLLCLLGTFSAALPALFATDVRYGSLAISYNVSVSLFGGTTPLVLDALTKGLHDNMVPAYYSTVAALVGVIAVLLMKETAQKPLLGSPPAVSTQAEADTLRASLDADPKAAA